MGKITQINKLSEDKIIERLEEILEMAKNGELKNFVLAGDCKDIGIATAWACCDLVKRQELISHLQIDVMYAVVLENLTP